ncbi:hypothetical protein HDU87_004293 [Geranomyces variabilis]|uniref:Uncharacterized protein n=1 Tax=Geranomyces variabilis TaxID=109894 RepID=A0AAD5TLB0_9FUNG|nr:hypothetical protein HDU87_004293 [Geranomyces variabilis]
MQARNISVLGYVPTGYFNHSAGCNQEGACQTLARIEAQIQAYYQNFPTLNGIFFDEVAPTVYTCSAFAPEYSRLRTLVHTSAPSNATATIAFNTAVPDTCAVDAAQRGEIVVLYEGTAAGYGPASNSALVTATAHARTSGVQTWHIVNTAPAWDVLVPMVTAYDPDWVYATSVGGDWQHGDDTYGAPPVYWAAEVASFAPANATAGQSPTSRGYQSRGRKATGGPDWTRTALIMALAASTAACFR